MDREGGRLKMTKMTVFTCNQIIIQHHTCGDEDNEDGELDRLTCYYNHYALLTARAVACSQHHREGLETHAFAKSSG